MKKLINILKIIYRNMKFTFFEEVKREIIPPKIPKNPDGRIYIHLGCGRINAKEFINVDLMPYSHIHYISHVENLSMFPNEYADLIYASHILEHLSHNNLIRVLKEWHRVLKKGGILRISVPDIDKLINVYLSEEKKIKLIIGPLMGGQNNPYNFHKSVFNENYLKELLLSVGFREIKPWNPEEAKLHSFKDCSSFTIKVEAREYFISLNLEAVK